MSATLQTSFYFGVSISGESASSDAAFQEVSGLSKELGTEDIVSGGENRFKFRLPTTTTYPNLVLKRGIVLSESPLIQWCQLTLDSGLSSAIMTKNIMINLYDEDGQSNMQWSFEKAYPLKWSMTDLKSQESSLLVETIEFAYQYFEVDDSRENQALSISSLFDD